MRRAVFWPLLASLSFTSVARAQHDDALAYEDGDPFGPVVPSSAPPLPAPRHGSAAHVPGTEITVHLEQGEVLTVATCGLTGARHDGDTTLALRDPHGTTVASNDDACGSLGSRIAYRAVTTGTHAVVLGCYSSSTCGGRVEWAVGGEEAHVEPVSVSAAITARALAGPDGQGAIFDGSLSLRVLDELLFRLSTTPMGIAGGPRGGVLGGSVQLLVGFDVGFVEMAVGGGVATLSQRPGEVAQSEVGTLALSARIGIESDFRAGALVLVGFAGEHVDGAVDADAVLPLDAFELIARGVYGFQGVWLAELGFVAWPGGVERRGVGVGIVAGAGTVFYQPVCRFGLACDVVHYPGASVGLTLRVRP